MKETETRSAPTPEALERMRHDSGVAVLGDGSFTYRGRPVENDRVVELFARGLDVREDGKVTLTVGRFVAYPEVEGVARFVRRIEGRNERAVLADGRVLPMADAAVAYGPDDRFYVWFAGVRGPAIMLREAHQAFAAHLTDQEGDGAVAGSLGSIPRPDSSFPPDDARFESTEARPRSRA